VKGARDTTGKSPLEQCGDCRPAIPKWATLAPVSRANRQAQLMVDIGREMWLARGETAD